MYEHLSVRERDTVAAAAREELKLHPKDAYFRIIYASMGDNEAMGLHGPIAAEDACDSSCGTLGIFSKLNHISFKRAVDVPVTKYNGQNLSVWHHGATGEVELLVDVSIFRNVSFINRNTGLLASIAPTHVVLPPTLCLLFALGDTHVDLNFNSKLKLVGIAEDKYLPLPEVIIRGAPAYVRMEEVVFIKKD